MVMIGPGRRAGPQRWARCGASPFELLFEGEGRLLHVVLGTRRADREPQASVSAPAREMHPPGFRQVRRTGRPPLWAWSAWRAVGLARRAGAEKFCDTRSQGRRPAGQGQPLHRDSSTVPSSTARNCALSQTECGCARRGLLDHLVPGRKLGHARDLPSGCGQWCPAP